MTTPQQTRARLTRPTLTRARLTLLLVVTVPALVAAVIGLTHPMRLDESTALYWQNMHIALIVVFPLIGIAPWLIARRVDRRLGWVAAVLGYGFATLYTALDILAGVGAGALVLNGESDATGPVFDIARILARVGVASLVGAAVVAAIAAIMRARLLAVPGALMVIGGAYLVYPGHIYFPVGTLAMLLLAGGFAILGFLVTRPDAAVDPAPAPA